ncbi:MAG: hypothetical protein H0Z39_02535 [Peptococcaceae bacterium]|nr:hypothetical protein [Peptococcaceae bacterium]
MAKNKNGNKGKKKVYDIDANGNFTGADIGNKEVMDDVTAFRTKVKDEK